MKKTTCIIITIILSIIVCIPVFLCHRNKVQTVLFSAGTALSDDAIFSLHNHKTNQVYILQTNKQPASCTLYRYVSDDTMKKYVVTSKTVYIFESVDNEWIYIKTTELPADPFVSYRQIKDIYYGKTKATDNIRPFIDLLFMTFTSTKTDSATLIDYSAFESVFKELRIMLHQQQTRKEIAFSHQRKGVCKIYECTPFANNKFRNTMASLLSDLFCDDYKESFLVAFTEAFEEYQQCKLIVTLNAFGKFQSMQLLHNNKCIFTIDKYK